jgi:hypothetical protein
VRANLDDDEDGKFYQSLVFGKEIENWKDGWRKLVLRRLMENFVENYLRKFLRIFGLLIENFGFKNWKFSSRLKIILNKWKFSCTNDENFASTNDENFDHTKFWWTLNVISREIIYDSFNQLERDSNLANVKWYRITTRTTCIHLTPLTCLGTIWQSSSVTH